MKARFNQVPLCLTIALLSALVGSCGLSGGGSSDDANVQQSPLPTASQPFPSPSAPVTIKSPTKIALTRPTNPDDRLRVIKSGRNDPFGLLVSPQSVGGTANTSTQPSSTSQDQTGKSNTSSDNGSLKKPVDVSGNQGQSGNSSGASGTVTLPSLPAQPEPANVKVTGVIVVAGQPRAIVQAPDEPTSRTVGVGDSLSGGQLYVKNIDMSNRAEPTVIFQQGNLEFAVAVGRDPVLVASAPTANMPVRGLYSVQSR